MNSVWLKPEQTLQNKCRGRHHWESFEEMAVWCRTKCPVQCRWDKRYPFEDAYFVPGLGKLTKDQFEKLQTCTIAFTMVPEHDINGHEEHWYLTAYGHNGAVFVKSFKDGVLETTRNAIEAKHFYSDDEADKVLEYLRDTQHPWTIALQDFEGNKSVCASVHYPNRNWNNNGNLQPSLMHKTVREWDEEHNQ
jgi:hypothetical protein